MQTLVYFTFSVLMCSCSNLVSFAQATKNLRSFSIDLIHRDSPSSPFYNSSMTQSELIRNAALRSIARFNNRVHHEFSLNQNDQSQPSLESIIVPNGGDYLMRIYIGTPPVERFAAADTGSDLIWVQCSPCEESKCFPQNAPLFDPKSSSTFTPVACDQQPCALLRQSQNQRGCESNICEYYYSYGDKSFTKGELATESINFGSNNGGQGINFPKSIFGCGYNNEATFSKYKRATGLVGLGGGPLSLVSQLGDEIGHKFSYCLVPFTSSTNSILKFGDEATISSNNGVVSTPLTINPSSPTFYILNLEGISVGQNRVESGQNGGIIIDSGTTYTFLDPGLYNNFVATLKENLGVEAAQNPPRPFDFCFSYDGTNNNNNNVTFPDFVFHFTGADVPLKVENLLGFVDENLLCLLVLPNTMTHGLSIFGNVAQINFQVEYDLEMKKVSFAPTDCTKN